MKKIFNSRFSLSFAFIVTFLILSTIVRLSLYIASLSNLTFSFINLGKIIFIGLYFDLAVALFFTLVYNIYLLLTPKKLIGTWFDRAITFFMVVLMLFIAVFGLIGEFPFWEEFNNRYNFIAVDYLIYTYEVVENINQSYPIPLIVVVLLSIIAGIFYLYNRKKIFNTTFNSKINFKTRLTYAIPLLALTIGYMYFANNSQAEWSKNKYENELSKDGIFSIFAAYISNELDYETFYANIPDAKANKTIRKELLQDNEGYMSEKDLIRYVENDSSEIHPNIIMITIESLSSSFMKTFGNKENITPYLDSLTQESIFFNNLYATGTRTVRGMEALTLCVPPTPGNSIVRRPKNEHLFSIATVMKKRNYDLSFIYGGDGYFDNMNYFFGNQGFNIIDRDRGNPLSDNIETTRYPIKNDEVTFENAWGVCDEDIYRQSLKFADLRAKEGKPFFQFIMTTSNHRPYSFPEDKIDLPQGSRAAAVKYTDFAIRKFITEAKSKPWFKNTIFIIIADHCARSAGKWEINITKHHIPAFIYNFKDKKEVVNKLVSQTDIYPTLFGLLNWTYDTEFYGKDIFKMKPEEERALIGNYRTLGLLKNDIFTQLDDRKGIKQFNWDNDKKVMKEAKNKNKELEDLTVSYYQTASKRFKYGLMKETKNKTTF